MPESWRQPLSAGEKAGINLALVVLGVGGFAVLLATQESLAERGPGVHGSGIHEALTPALVPASVFHADGLHFESADPRNATAQRQATE